MGSADPFSVDFDPVWARKMPDGSFAQQRYLRHVIEQAMEIIAREPIGVLFATPPVLSNLGERMTECQRARIVGVHYGGMSVTPKEMQRLQQDVFANAHRLGGTWAAVLDEDIRIDDQPLQGLETF